MKQRRLSHNEKIELFAKYESGKYTATDLAKMYPISNAAISALLKRHGYKSKPQSELQRKYPIDESFFDEIDAEEKAYFLGILYADGYNNTNRNSVTLSLKENDREILEKLKNLLQTNKPLLFAKKKGFKNSSNQYSLIIANKHISQRLVGLGCYKAKTFIIKFPTNNQVPNNLIRHFIRGYLDGDGYISKTVNKPQVEIVGTLDFCNSLADILKVKFNINTYIRTRFPERHNNIRQIEISAKQAITFLNWIYKDSIIYLKRKHDRYLDYLRYRQNVLEEKENKENIKCKIDECDNPIWCHGLCRHHYYERYCKEKRHERYINTGK